MPESSTVKKYRVADFTEISSVPCPCGMAKRAFADAEHSPGTIHVTEIADDARVHYHKEHTETYYILECGPDAKLQLDDEQVPLKPGMSILIPPGVRHRAIGQMKIINIVVPKFDPADEFFDDECCATA